MSRRKKQRWELKDFERAINMYKRKFDKLDQEIKELKRRIRRSIGV